MSESDTLGSATGGTWRHTGILNVVLCTALPAREAVGASHGEIEQAASSVPAVPQACTSGWQHNSSNHSHKRSGSQSPFQNAFGLPANPLGDKHGLPCGIFQNGKC